MLRIIVVSIWTLCIVLFCGAEDKANIDSIPKAVVGDRMVSADSGIVITCAARLRNPGYGENRDIDINSPKSVTFSRDGRKMYVNSLEGCATVVYESATLKKIKVIQHRFSQKDSLLWLPASGFYDFTHYTGGESRPFRGKPVESALTPDGRYLFVSYYRRTFDINAQDPSAIAIIDTRTDSIVAMTESGPLPKMVTVSNDGNMLAITHWGDNTVGLMDISSEDIHDWHHLPPVVVGRKLKLDYSLDTPVNRDASSGFLLRGTLFLPGDSLLLVSGMAGPVSVIDLKRHLWAGTIPSLQSVRHISRHGDMLYMSRNVAGDILRVSVDSIVRSFLVAEGGNRFDVKGVESCHVGDGARTLKISPDGKYAFVACNLDCRLYVVRTSDMSVVGSISADAFPVGLDISPDGRMVVTTSQGRKNNRYSEHPVGGNAVNVFSVDYLYESGEMLSVDSVAEQEITVNEAGTKPRDANEKIWLFFVLAAAAALLGALAARRKR